jgi:hypothetical protein
MHTFIELPVFARVAEDYFTEGDLADLKTAIASDPTVGDAVPVRTGSVNCAGSAKGRVNALVFASLLLGVTVQTLQAWEQGEGEPAGAVKTLLCMVERHPHILHELAE